MSLFDRNDKIQRSYTRFTDEAYSGRFRKDGKLLVVGEKTGFLKVFDVTSKAVLRQIKGHTSAVKATVWAADGLHMISGSDDKKIKVWDLGTEEMIWESSHFGGHSDYVRCLSANPMSHDLFASGSYDHSVKLWDTRQPAATHSLPHNFPVECCLTTMSGTLLLSAAGSAIQVWDLVGGGKLLHTFNSHQKNVSCMTFDGTGSRLISGGLDGHLKIYSLHTMETCFGLRLNTPVLSVGISTDNMKLVVGHVDGTKLIDKFSSFY